MAAFWALMTFHSSTQKTQFWERAGTGSGFGTVLSTSIYVWVAIRSHFGHNNWPCLAWTLISLVACTESLILHSTLTSRVNTPQQCSPPMPLPSQWEKNTMHLFQLCTEAYKMQRLSSAFDKKRNSFSKFDQEEPVLGVTSSHNFSYSMVSDISSHPFNLNAVCLQAHYLW